jgi:hypothetical protein
MIVWLIKNTGLLYNESSLQLSYKLQLRSGVLRHDEIVLVGIDHLHIPWLILK